MLSHIRLLLVLALRNRKSHTTSSKADGGLFLLLYTWDFVQGFTTDAHFKVITVPLNGCSVRAQTSLPEFTVNRTNSLGNKSL